MANRQGNTSGQKHGGEAAVKSLQLGQDFSGLALAAQNDVETRLELHGPAEIARNNAIRSQAATDLYWNAVLKAAQSGDFGKFDGAIARFGWLVGVSSRQWEALDRMTKGNAKGRALEALAKDGK
jgi:hypothetical protein